MRAPARCLVESGTLFLHEALVAVTLEHGLSLGAAALTPAPRTVLEARLGRVSGLDKSRGGHCTNKNSQILYITHLLFWLDLSMTQGGDIVMRLHLK